MKKTIIQYKDSKYPACTEAKVYKITDRDPQVYIKKAPKDFIYITKFWEHGEEEGNDMRGYLAARLNNEGRK